MGGRGFDRRAFQGAQVNRTHGGIHRLISTDSHLVDKHKGGWTCWERGIALSSYTGMEDGVVGGASRKSVWFHFESIEII